MKTNSAGLKLIKEFEGCRLKAYKCPAGVWTIGYGHTAGVKEGDVITQAKADEYLKKDLQMYESYVSNSSLELNENQFSALVSFTYNCGAGNLMTLIKGRSLSQIADALLLYNKANGKTLTGLIRRRKAERELFLTPVATKGSSNYLPRYTGSSASIVEALDSLGVDSSYKYRKLLAIANGITSYKGTAAQNTTMLVKLKSGKLLKA